MPSVQALKKCRTRAVASEGCDTEACGSTRDRWNAKPGEISCGYTTLDEIKLKNDTHASALVESVTRFTSRNTDFNSINAELASIEKGTLSENSLQKVEGKE